MYRDLGAQLERAVINFFLDTHIAAGYREITTPYMVLSDQLSKPKQQPITKESAADSRRSSGEQYITALYRNMTGQPDELPISHCMFSAGFRSYADETGQDVGGLIQPSRFHKVELMTICKPERSYDELSRMTEQAQKVLQLLALPYRMVLLATGNLPFYAAKTYELEVWLPSYNRYVSVSSCSACEDFHARRDSIRYLPAANQEPRFCHTLSGSGVAVGRTVAALLEHYQNEDGSVTVPEALRPYMPTDIIR